MAYLLVYMYICYLCVSYVFILVYVNTTLKEVYNKKIPSFIYSKILIKNKALKYQF